MGISSSLPRDCSKLFSSQGERSAVDTVTLPPALRRRLTRYQNGSLTGSSFFKDVLTQWRAIEQAAGGGEDWGLTTEKLVDFFVDFQSNVGWDPKAKVEELLGYTNAYATMVSSHPTWADSHTFLKRDTRYSNTVLGFISWL